MAIVNKFNVNREQVTLNPDIIVNLSANDVPYDSSFQYDKNTVGEKLSELEYDITANNNGVTFSSLSELLSSENLSTLIPMSVRHGGMSIRFVQSSDNKYVQYRLASSIWSTDIHDWTSEDPYFIVKIMQEVNKAIDENTPIEITGDVTNAPDEEDLTSVNIEGTDVLKFKDKVYNPLTYSGMGRIILRKNIVNGVNVLTQSMINQSNTIYVIQYDFTLGEDITIPSNCILKFDGGSFKNGTLTGNKTHIIAQDICFENINILGTFINLKPQYFKENNSNVISFCINNNLDTEIDFLNKEYIISSLITITKGNCVIKNLNITIGEDYIFRGIMTWHIDYVIFDNLNFNGNNNCVRGVTFNNCKNCAVLNSSIINIGGDSKTVTVGLELQGDCSYFNGNNIHIKDVSAQANSTGILISQYENSDNTITYSKNITIQNCNIKNIIAPADADGIKVLELINDVFVESHHTFDSIVFENCNKRAIKLQCSCPIVRNITCKNGTFDLACIDFFGDFPILDGLYTENLIVNNHINIIFLHDYQVASIRNVHAINNNVTFNDINCLIKDGCRNNKAMLSIENVESDINVLIWCSDLPESNEGCVKINNVYTVAGYHYLMMGHYKEVTINQLTLDRNKLQNYWFNEFEYNPDTIISDNYIFSISLSDKQFTGKSNFINKVYYTSTKQTLTTFVKNGVKKTIGVDWASYPHALYYNGYVPGDILELPACTLSCLVAPSSDDNSGKWKVEKLKFTNRESLTILTNYPDVYDFTCISLVDKSLSPIKPIYWNGTAWVDATGNLL